MLGRTAIPRRNNFKKFITVSFAVQACGGRLPRLPGRYSLVGVVDVDVDDWAAGAAWETALAAAAVTFAAAVAAWYAPVDLVLFTAVEMAPVVLITESTAVAASCDNAASVPVVTEEAPDSAADSASVAICFFVAPLALSPTRLSTPVTTEGSRAKAYINTFRKIPIIGLPACAVSYRLVLLAAEVADCKMQHGKHGAECGNKAFHALHSLLVTRHPMFQLVQSAGLAYAHYLFHLVLQHA
jgi:hypothetical protein